MSFEEFKQALHVALTHLYDPDYQPEEVVYLGAGCDPGKGVNALQAAIIREIESLKPEPDVPASSRIWRDFDVLYQRFVLRLSQEETAERMAMSVRNVQRAQREAIHLLARQQWDQVMQEDAAASAAARAHLADEASPELAGWRSQIWQELAWLQKSAAGAGADLQETIEGVLRIVRVSVEGRDIQLEMAHEGPDVRVRSHPSVLRQILLDGIQQLARRISSGGICLSIEQDRDVARINMVGRTASAPQSIDVSLARELLTAQGGAIESHVVGDSLSLVIELPMLQQTRGKAKVLVVDDNPDMATVFEAYCVGTRYEIVPLRAGKGIPKAIKAHSPDVILLDVIMPDVDGWDLLLKLQGDPATKSVPVIICSVVTDERLALTLGAALYLRKPVYREQLINALDQVLNQVAADA
jgi:CheY-like chemotaxis protein